MGQRTNNSSNSVNENSLLGRLRSIVLFSVAAIFSMLGAQASEWQFSPSIFAGTTYTSNVRLSPDGFEESELIYEISPSILIARKSKRVDVMFDYRLQSLLYNEDDARNEAYSYLQASAKSSVVPDLLYLDLSSSISQTVIDPRSGIGNSSISVSGNTSEVINVDISPYIQRDIGAFTQLHAGVRAGLVEYKEPRLFDSTQEEIFATISNVGGSGIIDWTLNYTSRSVDYDIDRKIELIRFGADMGIRLGPRTELVVEAGEDQNDVGSLGGTRIAEGSYWNVGFRGGIGAHTEYDFRFGEQFFGNSFSATFSRTKRRITTRFTYTEAATTIGAQQLDYSNALSFVSDVGGFDQPLVDPSLYVRKRFDFSSSLKLAKSSWRANVYYEDRDFIRTLLDGTKENALGVGLEWSWSFDDVTSVKAAANYSRLDSRDGTSQPEDFRMRISVQRTLLESSYVTAGLFRTERSAGEANREFVENSIQLGFGRQF